MNIYRSELTTTSLPFSRCILPKPHLRSGGNVYNDYYGSIFGNYDGVHISGGSGNVVND